MESLLETRELTKHFGGIVANNNIDLTIKQGTITGLIGPNGSGKTTFINQISGVYPPTSGTILFHEHDITAMSANQRATLGVSRTFQRIRLFEKLNVVENVLVSRKKFYTSTVLDIFFKTKRLRQEEQEQFDYAMDLLQMFGLEQQAFMKTNELPYGKRRALEIARAMALEPALLLLDEPAAGMTKDEFQEIIKTLDILREKGITMLLVEHTMDFIRRVVDWVYVLNFGKIIAQGTFEEIEKDEGVITAYLGEDML